MKAKAEDQTSFTIRIKKEHKKKIDDQAAKEGLSTSAYIRSTLLKIIASA